LTLLMAAEFERL